MKFAFSTIGLMALALSTVAYADTVDFSGAGSLADHNAGTTGQLANHSRFGIFDTLMEITDQTTGKTIQGQDLGKVMIDTGRLHPCAQHEFCANTGILDITAKNGTVLFDGALTDITIRKNGGTIFLSAAALGGGTVAIVNNAGDFSSNSIVQTSLATVPEPSALLLMGTGFIGLSFLRRRLQ